MRVVLAVAWGVVALVVAAVIYRVHCGVDFTDESFYIAMALRFARGDRPFVDELNITQTASLLAYPIVRLSLWWHHGSDGVVRLIRLVWVLLASGAALVAFVCLRRLVAPATALLAALIPLLVMPYNLAALSYNTIGSAGFYAGLFLGHAALARESRRRWLCAAGVAHGLACIAYPSLLLPCAAFFFISVAISRRSIAWYLLGAALTALPMIPSVWRAGATGLGTVVHASGGMGARDGHKLRDVLWALINHWPRPLLGIAGLSVLVIAQRMSARVAAILIPLWPLTLLAPAPDYTRSLVVVAYLGLSAPLTLVGLRREPGLMRLLWCVWLPSLLGGLVFGWTSGNGVLAVGLGLLPAATVTLVLFAAWSRQCWDRQALALAPVIAVALLLPYQFRGPSAVYRDAALDALDTRVATGPFAGLYTTAERVRSMTNLQREIDRVEDRGGRIGFYYDYPAGYLFAHVAPAFSSAWSFHDFQDRLKLDAQYLRAHATGHNVIFKIQPAWTDPDLDAEIKARYLQLPSSAGYQVFKEQAGP
jgi:hypothetical protein